MSKDDGSGGREDFSLVGRLRAAADMIAAMKIREPEDMNKRKFGSRMNVLLHLLTDQDKRVWMRGFLREGQVGITHCMRQVLYGDEIEPGVCTCEKHSNEQKKCAQITRHHDDTTTFHIDGK